MLAHGVHWVRAGNVEFARVPRDCFAVPNWNGEILICDPRAELESLCRALVYLHDDVRVRIAGCAATATEAAVDHPNSRRLRVDPGKGNMTLRKPVGRLP
jgi:hypothetical protein